MLTKAKLAVLVGSILAVLVAFFPEVQFLQFDGLADLILKVLFALLPLAGGAFAFFQKREPEDSLNRWIGGLEAYKNASLR